MPVYDFLFFLISDIDPLATTCPPFSPPSGPKSIIQSAFLITSKLCSIIKTLFPFSTKLLNTARSFSTS